MRPCTLRFIETGVERTLLDEVCCKPWFELRKQQFVPMPKLAWVVEDSETKEPLAIGGLIRTDSEFAMVDGYVASPKITSEERYKYLGLISKQALKTAKTLGYERCLCLTRVSKMVDHAKLMKAREDFKGYELLAIHLSDWSFE